MEEGIKELCLNLQGLEDHLRDLSSTRETLQWKFQAEQDAKHEDLRTSIASLTFEIETAQTSGNNMIKLVH